MRYRGSMKVFVVVVLALLAPAVARGDSKAPEIAALLSPDGVAGATAALVGNGVYYGASAKDMGADFPAGLAAKNVAVGSSKDKRSYWASADLTTSADPKTVVGHASALWERADKDKDYKLVAFALLPTATGKQQKAAIDKGIAPAKVKEDNGASSEYFMTAFGAFGADAADSVSTRKDVVVFGSAPNERFVGGAKASATIKSWNLMFDVRDGKTSGLTKGRILWVITNFDARPQGKDKAKPVPYRAFLIFEGDGSGSYALVHGSFAAPVEKPWP